MSTGGRRRLVRGLNHVTLAVTDLERSIRFYRDVFDAEPAHVWDEGAYLRVGDAWLCLSLDPEAARQPRTDYTHLAFDIGAADVEAFRRRAREFGAVEWKENTSEGPSVYLLDPDGHRLEAHAGTLESRLAAIAAGRRVPHSARCGRPATDSEIDEDDS